jgi:hypothetical protein
MNHGQIQTHKIHHDPKLGETTTFPLIIYSMAGHGTSIQMAFSPRLPLGSSKIPIVGTPTTLGAHNFAHTPTIEMRSKAKL